MLSCAAWPWICSSQWQLCSLPFSTTLSIGQRQIWLDPLQYSCLLEAMYVWFSLISDVVQVHTMSHHVSHPSGIRLSSSFQYLQGCFLGIFCPCTPLSSCFPSSFFVHPLPLVHDVVPPLLLAEATQTPGPLLLLGFFPIIGSVFHPSLCWSLFLLEFFQLFFICSVFLFFPLDSFIPLEHVFLHSDSGYIVLNVLIFTVK